MKRLDFSSLRIRLLLLIILASIPAMVLIINNAAEERSTAVAHIQADTMQLTQLTVANQEEWIEGSRQLLVALGNLPAVRNRDGVAASEFFAEIKKEYPLYANIFAATPDGDLFASAIPLKLPVKPADRIWFTRAVSNRDFAIGNYQAKGRITGVPVLVAAYPIYDEEGNLQAVVCVSLDLDRLNERVQSMQLSPDTSFHVIDQNGTTLACNPDPQIWVGRSLPEADIIKTILDQHEGTAEVSGVDNVTRFFAFAPVHSRGVETGIFVSVGIPTSIVFAEINHTLVRNLTFLAIVILFMFGIAWFGSDYFVMRNVNALMNATRRLGTGDLSVRTGMSYDQGEMGELACVFDGMVGSLEEREKELKAAHNRFEDVLNNIDSLVYVIDMKTYEVLFINKFGKDNWGQVEGKICWQTMQKGKSGPCEFCTNKRLIGPDGKPTGTVVGDLQNSSNKRWYNCQDRAIYWPDGRLVRIEIATDITPRKLVEEELTKYREHLEELVKERTADLDEKNKELEQFNKLFVGRELKMIELKKRIAELEKDVGPDK